MQSKNKPKHNFPSSRLYLLQKLTSKTIRCCPTATIQLPMHIQKNLGILLNNLEKHKNTKKTKNSKNIFLLKNEAKRELHEAAHIHGK